VPGREWQARLTWHDVMRIRKRLKVPLMLKGIATAEDARIALDHGIDVIYVSNHGGRQLDQGQGAMEVLPEIVKAVDAKAKIIIDGGFCRGTDVIKAIAAGAQMVAMGRMQCIALAAGGKSALVRMLELLDAEIRIAMALCGVNTLDELNPSYLCFSEPVLAPHTWGAFPLLDESLAFQRKS
jgi:isopentenyl diphosphate isomerase/L-lactate dehydrogenase-like FMN-dependent dehydrogenase